MSSTRRPLAALGMVALIGLAGCSSVPAATSTDSSGGNTAANREQAMKFAACMRDNGVSAFPDPDASGAFTVDGIVNGSSLDPNSAAWKTAIGACKSLEPAGFMGGTRSTAQQSAALKFAQCVRDNGVPDFPDPANGEPLVDTNRIPSAATEGGMSILNAAMHTCGAIYAGQLGLGGR